MNIPRWLQELGAIIKEIFEGEQKPMPTQPTKENPDVMLPWENKVGSANNRHNVRVLCDLAGLDFHSKNIITACIEQESDFYPLAKGPTNQNGTHDWGICQFNDGTIRHIPLWIGQGAAFGNVQEVLNNPEKCVNLMIIEFKAGHINWWSSYSTGAYLKYMPK